jgi:hypothetical protein
VTRMPNNAMQATRETRAPDGARWASRMRILTLSIVLSSAMSAVAADNPASDFDAALAKWRTADLKNYSFMYEWRGGVVIAPKCADAKIRVVVRNGVGSPPVVAKGSRRCPRGARGEKAIGFIVPATIDAAFAQMRRYVYDPPTPARIDATYDPELGIPLTYSVHKQEIEDNDEGFRISGFRVLK